MRNRGFTIVESLVAISILVVTITSTSLAVRTAVSSYILSKDQVVAFYLAQEGIEQIRNLRDQNYLTHANWLSGISELNDEPCYFGSPCTVDPVATTALMPCNGVCPRLKQDPVTGFFGYNLGGQNPDWPETIFRRTLGISEVNPNEIVVSATIDWSKGLITRQFKAQVNLLNWQ